MTSAPLEAGRAVGRYEIIAPIGSGGMATVYLGRARGLAGFERLVAIKLCHVHLKEEHTFVSMFLEEARIAAKIHHPNVVATIDVRHDDELYIVMEYVEGGALAALLREVSRQGEQLPPPIVLRIMVDALRGLQSAHELTDHDGRKLNIIHRDVSPQNVLVGTDGVSRISDFGIAKAEVGFVTTRPGQVKGKHAYMAPEQLRKEPLSRRVDVFASAVVLWEALTGERLFRGTSQTDTVSRVLSGPIRSVLSYREDLPETLDAVIRDGLERDAEHRFETARAFGDALESVGVPLASQEEVGGYVSTMLEKTLEKRRALLRSVPLPASDEVPPSRGMTANGPKPAKLVSLRGQGSYWVVGGLVLALLVVVWGFVFISRTNRDGAQTEAPVEEAENPSSAALPEPPELGRSDQAAPAGAPPPTDNADPEPDAGASDFPIKRATKRWKRPTKHSVEPKTPRQNQTGEYRPVIP